MLTSGVEPGWGARGRLPTPNKNIGARAEMEPGLRVSDFGRVGSRVNVSGPVFDPVLSLNMRVNIVALFLQSNTVWAN